MFGKKKLAAAITKDAFVSAMPVEFYGGTNPVVAFKNTKAVVGSREQIQNDHLQRIANIKSFTWSQNIKIIFSNRNYLLIFSAGVFLLAVVIISWYYWRQAINAKKPLANNNIVQFIPAPTPVVAPEGSNTTSVDVVSSTPPTEQIVVTASQSEGPVEFPSPLLGNSADLDNDGLTDAEEELFKSDPGMPDTDKDGYIDSHEVYFLYNPIGKEPQKIIDSGLVNNYENPSFKYELYYPNNWAVGSVDAEYKDLLFSTLTGENIEVRVIDKSANQSFTDWFGVWAAQEKYSDLVNFETVFKEKGFRRGDYLVYYFPQSTRVITVAYHSATDASEINYREVIKMMARSFRWDLNFSQVPELINDEPIPVAETTTSNSSSVAASSTNL